MLVRRIWNILLMGGREFGLRGLNANQRRPGAAEKSNGVRPAGPGLVR